MNQLKEVNKRQADRIKELEYDVVRAKKELMTYVHNLEKRKSAWGREPGKRGLELNRS